MKNKKTIIITAIVILSGIWVYSTFQPRIAGEVLLRYYPEIKDIISGNVPNGTTISPMQAEKMHEFFMVHKIIKVSLALLLSAVGAAVIYFTTRDKRLVSRICVDNQVPVICQVHDIARFPSISGS